MPKRKLTVVDRERCMGCYSCVYACSRTWGRVVGVEKAALRIKSYPGAEGFFSVRICAGCEDPDCARVCPTGALKPSSRGYGVDFDKSLCTGCGACIDACTSMSLQWDEEDKVPVPCRHCGTCASFCPRGVLGVEEVE